MISMCHRLCSAAYLTDVDLSLSVYDYNCVSKHLDPLACFAEIPKMADLATWLGCHDACHP